jgi:uncharacterized protein YdcH (DUF465 family)
MDRRASFDGNGEMLRLREAHAQLDQRVRELDRRVFLTPAEQIELSDLKKRKLVVKDRIRDSEPPPKPVS